MMSFCRIVFVELTANNIMKIIYADSNIRYNVMFILFFTGISLIIGGVIELCNVMFKSERYNILHTGDFEIDVPKKPNNITVNAKKENIHQDTETFLLVSKIDCSSNIVDQRRKKSIRCFTC